MNIQPYILFIRDYFMTILDILIVAYIFYRGYLLMAGTRAIQILLGFVIVLLLAIVSQYLHLTTLNWLLSNLSTYIFIAVVILFQPELRRILSQVGQSRFLGNVLEKQGLSVEEVINAVKEMASEKVGSLIVISRQTGLKNFVETGTKLDAIISEELLRNIFYDKSPLHDGAVIIEDNKIASAASYLPLSDSRQIKRYHGARHRAGLGITEESDAVTIITSEETGYISVAADGKLHYNVDPSELKSILNQLMNPRT